MIIQMKMMKIMKMNKELELDRDQLSMNKIYINKIKTSIYMMKKHFMNKKMNQKP